MMYKVTVVRIHSVVNGKWSVVADAAGVKLEPAPL